MKKILTLFVFLSLILLAQNCKEEPPPTSPTPSDPEIPYSPSPGNNSSNQELDLTLQWDCTGASSYDVYFGTTNPPSFRDSTQLKSETVSGLSYSTQYYWQVKAHNNSGTIKESNIWKFATKSNQSAPGYKLYKHAIETELPSFVNIMFQVTDLNGIGVSNLETSNFEVLENGQPVSPTESAMHIKKKDIIPYTLKTVLLIDNSLSVADNLAEIKNSALSLVNNIVPQQEVAVYKFSEAPILLQDFTNDVGLLQAAINSIVVGFSSTDLYGSIIEGVSRWEDTYTTNFVIQGFLIALTDGSDTQASHTLNEALSARGDKKIYTIGLGNEIEPDILSQLGNAGFYSITDINNLSTKFAEIQEEMAIFANSFYWLNYMSPKRGNNNHSLELIVKDNPYSGSNSSITGEFNSTGFFSVLSGLYINPTSSNTYGIDSLLISEDDTISINAVTYLANNPPQYVWTSGNQSLILVEPNIVDPSIAYVISLGDSGQTTTITVEDIANSLSKTIDVIITKSSVPTEGLIAYYPFNGNANDESGNGNDGVLMGGAAAIQTLVIGHNALDHLILPNSIVDGLIDFTFSGSIKIHTINAYNVFLSCARSDNSHNELVFGYSAPNSKWHSNFQGNVHYFGTNTVIEDMDWHHIVFMRRSPDAFLYIDGVLISSIEPIGSNSLSVANGGFIIGQEQDNVGGGFVTNESLSGELDNLRIYNRDLTDDEILQIYEADKK